MDILDGHSTCVGKKIDVMIMIMMIIIIMIIIIITI